MENFIFHNPTKLIFGKGQIEKIAEETIQYGKKVLLVTGGSSAKKLGLLDAVQSKLTSAGCNIYTLEGVEPNPRLTTVHKGVNLCKNEGIEIVIAVGGGSVLDASKAICAGAKYDGDVWDFFLHRADIQDALPLGTVLTLAATGSEMNVNSVVSNWDTKQKLAIKSPHLFPKFSILDPSYTFTVPKDQTVYGIVDIMAHVFEQYFSHTENTPIQDQLCESVLRTVIDQSPKVLDQPDNYEARSNILYSGTMALNGMISMGMTGDWATHAIEHEVSAIYDIPHGGGLAILFPNWMEHVMDEGIAKFKQFAIRVWNVEVSGKTDREIVLEGIKKVREFFDSIGAPSRLKDYNIGDEYIEEMAEKTLKGKKTIGQFKKLEKEDIIRILQKSLI